MEKLESAPHGKLFVNPQGVAFLGRALRNEPHSHFTASVTLALDGTIQVRREVSDPLQEVYGLSAMPNEPQQLVAGGDALILNLQIDPETEAFARLEAKLWARERTVYHRDPELGGLRPLLEAARHAASPGTAMTNAVVEALGGPAKGPRLYDPRVAQVLELLKAAMPEAPSAQELGERVGLSEGRLIHLFSEQVGVPLRRYVLWLRIRHVVFCLALQRNLTDAAHEAGFADSAHLTRVFRSMFGMAPSHILRAEQVSLSLEIPSLPLTGPHAVQDQARLAQIMARFPPKFC